MHDLQRRLAGLSPARRALLEKKLAAVGKPLPETPQLHSKRQPDQPAALSFAQQRLWFLDQLLSGNSPYNVPTAVRLSGLLDVRCLEQSLNAVIERHEVLRTTIESAEGKPVQIVQKSHPLELTIHDLSIGSEAEREAEASKILAQETQRPFNLAQDLMLRATLIKLSEQEHLLLLVMHHIASDGWSMGILMRELSHFYEAEISGRPSSLPELPIQYADYAEWQLEWLQGEVLNKQLGYWKQQLAGAPTRLDLPTDWPRPAVQTFRGASQQLELSPELTQGLKALSLREKASLFMTLLAAFQVLLFRYTRQDDIVVGSPIAGRNRGEVEELIGFFVNTLALRTDLSGDPTFLELLRRVREVALNAYDHQDLPFERLVEDLQAERSLSHNPLFQVMFVLQNAPSSPLQLSGLQASPMRLVTQKAHFDLTLSITEQQPGLIARLSYSTDLFEDATIERMLGHFHILLEGIVKQPQDRISRLALLNPLEKDQLLREWNQTAARFPASCVHQLFEAHADRFPERVAIDCGSNQLTYRELNNRANLLAHELRSLGVGPEARVGVVAERSIELIVALLGIFKAGGAYVPLDPMYPEDRMSFMVQDAEIVVLLACQRHEAKLIALTQRHPVHSAPHLVWLDRGWGPIASMANLLPWASPDHLAYVIYTSGSTGKPKGVLITHESLSNVIEVQIGFFEITRESRIAQLISPSFDVSLLEIWGALAAGATLCPLPQGLLPGSEVVEWLRERAVTLLNTTPSFLTALPVVPLPNLKTLTVGGEPCPAELVSSWSNGRRFINDYGPTETTIFSICAECRAGGQQPGIGRPISNTEVYVLDPQLEVVPVGVPGELFIGGMGLGRGYLNRPDITAERFIPNPFSQTPGDRLYRTGDLVQYQPDGSLEFLGRRDHQVKIRGYRIELGEIESVLRQHRSVREAVVLVQSQGTSSQWLVAYIVGHDGPSCDVGELRSFLSKQVPDYMVPAAYVFLDALPLTPSGKVDRQGLPAVSGAERGVSEGYVGPRNEIERELTSVWEELLNVRPVSVKDNFFDLGGHSLLAMRLIARIEKTLGKRVSLASLFQVPTIEGLAKELQEGVEHLSLMPFRIEGSKQRQEPLIQPRPKAGQPAPLSFAQQRLWFLDQLLARNPVYNIPTAFRLSGFLDLRCLEQSLNAVIERHEILRTTIESVEGKPFQIVQESHRLELVVHDLGKRPEAEREAEASKLLALDVQRPFDLARDLMLRATLITLSGQDHILLMVMHHIASDGWSMGILMRELSHFYKAEISGRPNSLPELPIQYADYAEWQLEWFQGKVFDEQLDYWKRQLAGIPTRLELPTDRPRPAVQTFRGASRQLELSPELAQGLKALSLREKASLFMTLLTAFHVLLFRYTGQDDIVLGSPIAGRNRGDVEDLIGFFVNTLALRTDLSGDPTFLEVLRRVKEVALEAYDHQDLPFERLVDDLQVERSLSHNPLFQVMFVLQNAPSSPFELSGLQASPVSLVTETAHFDLTMSIAERRTGLIARLSYSTDLFEDPTIERMLGHFQVLLEGIVKQPGKRISDLPILKEAEKRQLDEWNQTKIEHSRDWDLAALFESQVDRTPDAVAVEFEGEALAYSDLNCRANQLAHLLKQMGVGPDVLVGLYMERSVETMVAVLSVIKAGGAYVPMDTTYPRDRLAFMLTDASPRVVITQQRLSNRIPDQKWSVICLDSESKSISKQGSANLTPEALPESLAYVIYTSGSTGRPKGVAMTRQALVNLVMWQCGLSNLQESGRTLQLTSLSFDVSFQEIFSTWCSGGSLVLVNEDIRRDSRTLLRFLHEKRINRLFLPFIALEHLAEAAASCDVLPSTLREVYTAGEQLIITPHILSLFEKLPKCSLHNHYGPSESHVVTAYPLSGLTSQWEPRPPIGRPIANCQVYILDDHSEPVPVGVAGQLFIAGTCLARGYLGRPEFTAERFVPNPFEPTGTGLLYKTGDLVRYRHDGNIEFLGRIDHQVKIRGFRVELGEIEAVLGQHRGVNQTVVLVREASPGDQRLVAYVVSESKRELSIPDLRKFLKGQLPDYMVPSHFVTLSELPVTPSGKVDRRALPKPVGSGGSEGNGYCPPRDRLEHQLVVLWASVLQIENLGVTDNFFDLGGHSLLAVKLLARINQSLDRNLPLVSVFQAPTVEQMAQLLRQKGWKPLGESLVVVQPNGSKPPFFCVHGWAGCFRLAAHLGQDQPVYGLVQGLEGNRFFTNVEELAVHYLKDIKSICPQGPYFLGGHSFGGLVALEMAQQLRKAGEEVGLLALFEPTTVRQADQQFSSERGNPKPKRQSSSERLCSRMLRHLRQLQQLPRETRTEYIRERFGMMLTLLGTKRKRLTCQICLRLGWSMPPALRIFFFREILFADSYIAASKAYRLKRYEGRALLILGERKGRFDAEVIWRALIPNGTRYAVQGDHSGILQEPHVSVLAGHLRTCLNEALETQLVKQ